MRTFVVEIVSVLPCSARISWRPGIGDPYPLAWVITVAYFVAAALCLRAGLRRRAALRCGRRARRAPVFWFVLAGMTFSLGCNKQLDLQTLLIQFEPEAVRLGHWRGYRRAIEIVLVVIYGVLGAACLVGGSYLLRRRLKPYALAMAGMGFLLAFVLTRAAFFHHIDPLVYHLFSYDWINGILELGGVALIAWGALLVAHETASQTPACPPN